jgi:alpha-1,2-mannosyltransferase
MEVVTPQRQRFPVLGQVGVLVGLAAIAGYLQWWYELRNHFFDLMVYREAMQWWTSGHPLYDFVLPDQTQGQLGFTYPPFAAVLLRPLAWLTSAETIAVFVVIAVLTFAATLWWLVRPIADRHGWPRWFVLGLAVVLATGLEPIRLSFDFGQINFVVWVLIVFDLAVLAPRGSRGFGVGIGLATAIKLVPGIFIVYLLVTRRWRAAAVATGTAIVATLVATAVSPGDSWTFFSEKMLHGDGVGQLAYPMNQSIMGLLARLAQPGEPSTLLWLVLALPVVVFGMWRAARASAAGDELTALALTGFVGSLISPVTWVHHLFWFIPALLALVDTAATPAGVVSGLRRRPVLLTAAVIGYATVTFSMIQWWDFTLLRPGGPVGFVLSNWLIALMVLLLVVLPIRPRTRVTAPALDPDQVAV